MAAFVCASCLKVVRSLYDRFEERTEYRRVSDHGRHKVILNRHLCRKCVDTIVEELRPSGPSFTQGTLT
jgi:DNA-directed RNA polymerase subunit N (RpoN/RPB10)